MKAGKAPKGTPLWWIGMWATIWFGLSGLYLVLLIWVATDYYTAGISWVEAVKEAYAQYSILTLLVSIIITGWIIGAIVWLRALKKAKISRKAGLKDILLTVRK